MLAQGNDQESQMKSFEVTSGMTNMRGVFYPTGHMVLMFPTEQHARHACELLRRDGVAENDLFLAAPADFERQIGDAIDDYEDVLLPSVGTEMETARRFRHLAHEGHHALIVHASAALSSDHVLQVLRDTPISYGQRYRFLVIEDLVSQ
jgi:hypothetical protein